MKKFLSSIVLVGCCQAGVADIKSDISNLRNTIKRVILPLSKENEVKNLLEKPSKELMAYKEYWVKNLYFYLYLKALEMPQGNQIDEESIDLGCAFNKNNAKEIIEIYNKFIANDNSLQDEDVEKLLNLAKKQPVRAVPQPGVGDMPPPPPPPPPQPGVGGMPLPPPSGGIMRKSALDFKLPDDGLEANQFDFSSFQAISSNLSIGVFEVQDRSQLANVSKKLEEILEYLNNGVNQRLDLSDYLASWDSLRNVFNQNDVSRGVDAKQKLFPEPQKEIKNLEALCLFLKTLEDVDFSGMEKRDQQILQDLVGNMYNLMRDFNAYILSNREQFLVGLRMSIKSLELSKALDPDKTVTMKNVVMSYASQINKAIIQGCIKYNERLKNQKAVQCNTDIVELIDVLIQDLKNENLENAKTLETEIQSKLRTIKVVKYAPMINTEFKKIEAIIASVGIDKKPAQPIPGNDEMAKLENEIKELKESIKRNLLSSWTDHKSITGILFILHKRNSGFLDQKQKTMESERKNLLVEFLKSKNSSDEKYNGCYEDLCKVLYTQFALARRWATEDLDVLKQRATFSFIEKEQNWDRCTKEIKCALQKKEDKDLLDKVMFDLIILQEKVKDLEKLSSKKSVGVIKKEENPWETVYENLKSEYKKISAPIEDVISGIALKKHVNIAHGLNDIDVSIEKSFYDEQTFLNSIVGYAREKEKSEKISDADWDFGWDLFEPKEEVAAQQIVTPVMVPQQPVKPQVIIQSIKAPVTAGVPAQDPGVAGANTTEMQEINGLKQQLEELKTNITQLQQENSNLLTRLEAQVANAAMPAADIDKDAIIMDLQKQVKTLQGEINRLRLEKVGNAEKTKHVVVPAVTDDVTERLTQQHNANVSSLNLAHLADMGKKDSEISELKEENADLKNQMELHGIKYVGRGSSTIFKEDEEAKATRQQLEVTVKQQVEVIAAKDSQIKNQNVKIKELEVLVEKQGKELKELKDQDEAQENKITKEMLDEQQSMLEKLQQELESKEIVYNKKQAELDQREKQLNQREKGKNPTNTRNSRLLQQQQIKATNRSSKSVNPTAQAA